MNETLTILYAGATILGGLCYLPQIMTLIKDDSGAKAMNIWTWAFWTLDTCVISLYSIFVNGDIFFILCSVVNNIGCAIVFILIIHNRRSYNRALALAKI